VGGGVGALAHLLKDPGAPFSPVLAHQGAPSALTVEQGGAGIFLLPLRHRPSGPFRKWVHFSEALRFDRSIDLSY
jgi:hypothetical protein